MDKLSDRLKSIDSFFNWLNDTFTTPNPYGKDGILNEGDISSDKIFSLFKNKDSMLAQFKAHNLNHYKQGLTPKAFIIKFHRGIGSPKLHHKSFKEKHFAYIYNIPVLVVEKLPWDDPNDDIREMGNFYKTGILAVEYHEIINTVEHEMVHAMVDWLGKGGIFVKPINAVSRITRPSEPLSGLVYDILKQRNEGGNNFDRILTRVRNETLAYSLASPGSLHSRSFELAVRSLTGRDILQIQQILGKDADYIFRLVATIQTIDADDKKHYRHDMCIAMMNHATISGISQTLAGMHS